jgi:hypothetical protein
MFPPSFSFGGFRVAGSDASERKHHGQYNHGGKDACIDFHIPMGIGKCAYATPGASCLLAPVS